MTLNTLRGLIRPATTGVLVLALTVAAFLSADAFDRLKEPAMLVIGFYFGVRSSKAAG